MPTPGTFPGPVSNPQANGARKQRNRHGSQNKKDSGLNENYGREVMELHTIGVDGGYTAGRYPNGRVSDGLDDPRAAQDPQFFFDEKIHAQGKKVVMGKTFNYGGEKDGEEALKMLANSPKTASFISLELARHFVSDRLRRRWSTAWPKAFNRAAAIFARF